MNKKKQQAYEHGNDKMACGDNSYLWFEDKEAVKEYLLSDLATDERGFFEHAKRLAVEGDPLGQLYYGMCLSVVLGCVENNREAMKWWAKAASQGDADAQFNLGNYFIQVVTHERIIRKQFPGLRNLHIRVIKLLRQCSVNVTIKAKV